MTNEDYRELFKSTRARVNELGLSALDERIISNMPGSEGPFGDLLFYLQHLREEILLGSDVQYRETLRRIRRYVETESGEKVKGIRIEFTPDEIERHGMRELIVTPSRELGEIGMEFGTLIDEIVGDYDHNSGAGGTR